MYQDLKKNYWWPMRKYEVAQYVSKCLTRLNVKAKHQKPFGKIQPLEIPKWKWEHLMMDFVTKLPRTPRSNNDTIWIRETYNSDQLADLFIREIISRHGVPMSIVSDRDMRFTSSYLATIGMPPFEILNGRGCRTPVYWASIGQKQLCSLEVVEATTKKLDKIKAFMKAAQDKQKSYTDKRRRLLYSRPEIRSVPYLVPCWGGSLYTGFACRACWDSSYIPCVASKEMFGRRGDPCASWWLDNKLNYVEEPIAILDRQEKRLRNKEVRLVKVQWKHRKSSEATWESEDEMMKLYPQLFLLQRVQGRIPL
ncbi:uncharacterized protein LOC143591025 [Bidens hawaiensis]|uniref:uncharacterized protein LOC143591025 n=1 Tax=Bidens hawaiensis TaxID=980011 RepID=UPI004049A3FB